MQDYWEGDAIRLRSTGEGGAFGQVKDRYKATVAINGEIRTVPRSDIVLVEDEIATPMVKSTDAPPTSVTNKKPPSEIDIHLEVLDPSGQVHQNRMLDFQLETAKNYVEAAIEANLSTIKIIHGKGTGILKESLLHYLKDHGAVRYCIETNAGGATEVWLL